VVADLVSAQAGLALQGTADLVRLVPVVSALVVALHVRASVVALHVQDLVAALVPVLLVPEASALLALVVALVVAAVVTVVALLVRSVRAEAREPRRLVSRSARNAKSSNREWHRALVARSFLAVTAQPLSVYVVVRAFRTSPTRLRQLQLS
jgi:hypothetical protein